MARVYAVIAQDRVFEEKYAHKNDGKKYILVTSVADIQRANFDVCLLDGNLNDNTYARHLYKTAQKQLIKKETQDRKQHLVVVDKRYLIKYTIIVLTVIAIAVILLRLLLF